MRRCSEKSGFVLVMVLLVLTICGAVLAAAARHGARGAIDAAGAQRDLQWRWGALSCRAAVLPRAAKVMVAAEQPSAPEINRSVCLGDMTFLLILGDEQAKANVNAFADRDSVGMLEAHLRRLQTDAREVLPVRLRPLPPRGGGGPAAPKYASFDQVFAAPRPGILFEPQANGGPVVRRRVTCWGNGRIDLHRADLPVLRETLAGLLTEATIAKLDNLRREKPDFGLNDAFNAMQLSKEQLSALTPRLVAQPDCYSLWLSADAKTRSWRRLYVTQTSAGDAGESNWTFAW